MCLCVCLFYSIQQLFKHWFKGENELHSESSEGTAESNGFSGVWRLLFVCLPRRVNTWIVNAPIGAAPFACCPSFAFRMRSVCVSVWLWDDDAMQRRSMAMCKWADCWFVYILGILLLLFLCASSGLCFGAELSRYDDAVGITIASKMRMKEWLAGWMNESASVCATVYCGVVAFGGVLFGLCQCGYTQTMCQLIVYKQ